MLHAGSTTPAADGAPLTAYFDHEARSSFAAPSALVHHPYRESSPPELALNTPSPTSSAPVTSSEGMGSDPERNSQSKQLADTHDRLQSAMTQVQPPDALAHTRSWHQPGMAHAGWQHDASAFAPDQQYLHLHQVHPPDPNNHDAMFDEMICTDSVGPDATQPPPALVPQAFADMGGSSDPDYSSAAPFQPGWHPAPATPSVSATETKDDVSMVGSSTSAFPQAKEKRAAEQTTAQFGPGSHYSHTSDDDLGYTATTIVRPPRGELGKMQVHVHGIALIGAKSRVETQIRMRIELVRQKDLESNDVPEENAPDLGTVSPNAINTAQARFGPAKLWQRIGSFTHIKLPPGTGTRRKSRKYKEPSVDPQQTLFLDATVVNASPPHERVYVCEGCRTRERKRILRMKGRSKRHQDAVKQAQEEHEGSGDSERKSSMINLDTEEPPTIEEMQSYGIDPAASGAAELALNIREERARERVVVFNTGDYVEFHNGEAVLPTRITCYCRHHKEKIGFCIIFTLRDWTGQLLATGTTPPVMITDDHKTSSGPQAQAQMQAQADALAKVLAQAHANKAAALRSQGLQPPPTPDFRRISQGDEGLSPRSVPKDVGAVPKQDSTAGRNRSRRKSSTQRAKPYARRSSVASSSQPRPAPPSQQRRSSRSSIATAPAAPPVDTAMSPLSNSAPDARMWLASAPDQSMASPSVHPPHRNSMISPMNDVQGLGQTMPAGPMPWSAVQEGLAPDTLQPFLDQLGQHAGAPPPPSDFDQAMLMQAYTFARSQTEAAFGNNPMFFNEQGQPNPHVYAAMLSAMQLMHNGQVPQLAQPQPLVPPPQVHQQSTSPPALHLAQHRHSSSLASAVDLPPESQRMAADGTASFTPIPKITQLIPHEGPTTGGIEVTVLGENFVEGIDAMFGEHPAVQTKVWANNTLVCVLPPASSPGPVIVSFRLPNMQIPEEQAPLAFFTYVEQADRTLMELALQVVGLKMTGQMHSARDVAMRVVGTGADHGNHSSMSGGSNGSGSTDVNQHGNGVASQFTFLASVATSGSNKNLNFQDSLLSLLAMSDEKLPVPRSPQHSRATPPRPAQALRLPLERRGEAIRLTNSAGQTLLHLAVVLGFGRLVEDLLRRGAPINARDRSGLTPLHFAAMRGRTSIVRKLLRNFADPFARTRVGQTAIQLARLAGQEDTMELLGTHLRLVTSPIVEAGTMERTRCTSIDEDNLSTGESESGSESESESEEASVDPVEPSTLVLTSSQDLDVVNARRTSDVKPKHTDDTKVPPTDVPSEHSSASDEKKTLAEFLASSVPIDKSINNEPDKNEKSEMAPRKFGLSKLQQFFAPAFASAPISVFRMEAPPEHTLLPQQDKKAPPTYDSLGSSTRHTRRKSSTATSICDRKRKGKEPKVALTRRGSGSSTSRVKQAWWEDRMLVLFWLPALIVALAIFLLFSIGPAQHLADMMRAGSFFKLYPDTSF